MKVRDLSIHTVLFSALLITLSATSVSAQGKVKFKYVPAKAGTKPVSVPYVVNPNLSRAAQESITRWSGVAVLRSNATPKAKPPLVTPSPTTVKPLSAKDLTPAAISAKISIFPAQTSLAPVQAAAADTGTNLTGVQVLATYFPTWRQELGGMFSKEQLDAVEKAFADTDKWIFVRDEDGELQARNSDEWDYESRFLTILKDSGMKFTDRQIKQLVGARGLAGFTLKIYFVRMNGTGFSCAKGTSPRKKIVQKGHILTKEEMTKEEQDEMNIGTMINTYVKHPAIQAYRKNNRKKAEVKSPEEYVALARQYPDKPRSVILRDGRKIPREEMTPEELEEVIIGKGLATHRGHPAVIAYMKENRKIGTGKSAEEYVALAQQYSTKPRSIIYKDGRKLSREEMTPEELEEVIIGTGLSTHKDHPAVVAYMKENRMHAEIKSPEEYVTLARQYPGRPRQSIYKNGRKLTRKEMTEEEKTEVQIASGLYNYRSQPVVKDYFHENRRIAESKTPQEYVILARQYDSIPRTAIYNNGQRLSWLELSEAEKEETRIGQGLVRLRNHPLIQAYLQERHTQLQEQKSKQLYTRLVNYIQDYGHYPVSKKGPLYQHIYNRLHNYQSTMVDGKYQDPWLQKIYELKTAIQNAPEGKFTLMPDGQGGYILEIEETALDEEITAPQPVEEVAPAAPSPHTIRLRITEQTKNLIESVRDAAALERREFPGWLRSMHSAENFPQIVDKNTFDALHALSKAINFDHRVGQNRRAVTYLLQTVNNYVGALGAQPELGAFYKLIYRGKADPAMLPSADNFHLVAEEQGLSWDGELAPQVENVNRLLTQAAKQDTPFSVYLDGDEKMLTTIRTEGKVSAKTIHDDLSIVLKHLLPPGYEVRMGLHEIGISGRDLSKFRKGYLHLHVEHASVPNDDIEGMLIDHSISLDVDVRRFANRWSPITQRYETLWDKDIAQNYLELFDSFLSDEARQTLQELAHPSVK